jgi:hypothetical protein
MLGLPNAAIVAAGAGKAGDDHDGTPLNCDRRFSMGAIGIGVGIHVGICIDCAKMLGHVMGNSGIVIVPTDKHTTTNSH